MNARIRNIAMAAITVMTIAACGSASDEIQEEKKKEEDKMVFIEPYLKKDVTKDEIIAWMAKDTQLGGWRDAEIHDYTQSQTGTVQIGFVSKSDGKHSIAYFAMLTSGREQWYTRSAYYPYSGATAEKWLVEEVSKKYGIQMADPVEIDEYDKQTGKTKKKRVYMMASEDLYEKIGFAVEVQADDKDMGVVYRFKLL